MKKLSPIYLPRFTILGRVTATARGDYYRGHITVPPTMGDRHASPTLYEQSMSCFKRLGDGAYGLSSLSEKTKKFNHLNMSFHRTQFILSVSDLKTLSWWPRTDPEI